MSNNKRNNIDNIKLSHIGYLPKDDPEKYAKEIFKSDLTKEINDYGNRFHGGHLFLLS